MKTPEAVPEDFDPNVRSLTGTYKIDDRDNPFNTLSGTYTELNSELAGAFLQGIEHLRPCHRAVQVLLFVR